MIAIACLGLMFSPFMGFGGLLSIISLCMACMQNNKESQMRKWTIGLSVAGIALAVLAAVFTFVVCGDVIFKPDVGAGL